MTDSIKEQVRALLDNKSTSQYHTMRRIKDKAAKHAIAFGGLAVIIAVLLIFFYLLYVVLPIFQPADLKLVRQISPPQSEQSARYLQLEEYGELALKVDVSGQLSYLDLNKQQVRKSFAPTVAGDVTQVVGVGNERKLLALATTAGEVLLVEQDIKFSYPNNQRHLTPTINFPFGEQPLQIDAQERSLNTVAVATSDESLLIVGAVGNSQLVISRYSIEENFLTGETETALDQRSTFKTDLSVDYLLLDPAQRWLYVIDQKGSLQSFRLDGVDAEAYEQVKLFPEGSDAKVSAATFLLGGYSLLIGDTEGNISQWFPVREEGQYRLNKIRVFELEDAGAITLIRPEYRRKGFLASDGKQLGVFYTTSERTLLEIELDKTIVDMAINPRSKRVITLAADGTANLWKLENEHPELSWGSLWGEVWYENYPEPDYIYQSSASTSEFEPKFSLVPLSFGTLKAAFYAMLIAMPLAICGAMFTAYFMAPRMRRSVKPMIEIMEALPTVILGFLAGLWLAPLLEENLPGIFTLLIVMPLGIIAFGLVWMNLPSDIRHKVPDGWQAALLIPVVVLVGYLSFSLSWPVEQALFDGNMRNWLNQAGIDFDQRNSLVVGLAMGFAVIPTIFSIAEDAIFSVPRHLTNGSLALGASQWQTMTRVVLPTASPGIFSGVMIGMGRAVGETMIVLMATGNTPIMDFNIFEGMRTLSANIAVEMPESEVGSSHYRVLFLAGFVLFVFTFIFNTVAEVVRQRLRRKYGSL